MNINPNTVLGARAPATSTALLICAAALVSFTAGALATAFAGSEPAADPGHHVFELMIYHTLPGKAPDLEAVFRASASLKAQHHLDVIGYWVPDEDPAWTNTVVYLVAHPSRAAADLNWHALHSDPAFPPSRKAAEPLIQKKNGDYWVDEIYMRPSDFSSMK
jgi:hypothetical protein